MSSGCPDELAALDLRDHLEAEGVAKRGCYLVVCLLPQETGVLLFCASVVFRRCYCVSRWPCSFRAHFITFLTQSVADVCATRAHPGGEKYELMAGPTEYVSSPVTFCNINCNSEFLRLSVGRSSEGQ